MRQPSFFIPHGGGPCFFLNQDGPMPQMWQKMADFLAGLVPSLAERPRALLLITGHWEEDGLVVQNGASPDLLFDYYNFPPHTYQLRWDAPGDPALAARVADLLGAAGFPTASNAERGWDHGVFVPMKVALPDADIPTVQLSLRADLDPAAHIAIGRALAPLRDEGVLIIGSGMSFHNLRERGDHATERADAFDTWLSAAATDPDPAARAARLTRWTDAPFARFAHPREEHLLPLMVAAGAGGDDPATHVYRDHVLGWTVSGYRYG